MPISTSVQQFKERGYCVLPDLLSREEIAGLQQELLRICRGEYPEAGLEALPGTLSEEEVLARYLCIHHAHKVSQPVMQMMKHPRIIELLTQLIGPNIKALQSQFFVKGPGQPGNPWHQDERPIPTRDRSLVTVWIAVDDSDEENGCLWVIPGSHQSGYLYPERPHGRPDEFDFPTVAYGFDESLKEPVPVKSGSVIFFHGYLLHGSFINRSRRFRRALTYHYLNAYSLLPMKMRVAPDQLEARGGYADFRDVIPVAGVDPYAWQGYENLNFVHNRAWHSKLQAAAATSGTPAAAPSRQALPEPLRLELVRAIRTWPTDELGALRLLRAALEKARELGIE
jgi:phytanoyl-CoA hydroxylase